MSQAETPLQPALTARWPVKTDAIVYAAIGVTAVAFWWLTRAHVDWLPFWAPWEFSFVEYLSGWLAVFWYLRGLARTPAGEHPSLGRKIVFFAGVALIYAMLETRYEYLAEHQFFFNRIQHVCMHHIGPFLLALAWPGETLMRGMPEWLTRVVGHPALRRPMHFIQQPVLASVLFVGIIFFWLIPSIHFRAMIDPRLFSIMNWSMVVDGLLFWSLVLDPRPKPPARVSYGGRAAMSVLTMFPQIAGGAFITFDPRDLYSFYDLCGRIYPELGPHYDQTVGGLIIWIPPGMMAVLGLVIVLNMLRKAEEKEVTDESDQQTGGIVIQSSQWTG
ncbi:MAG TPA: cytochrome c oxidase assembly protein [Pseudolabrys sp.]|nr:cytochrome c oxidase assembly protein [Pseudolabrys sp.]